MYTDTLVGMHSLGTSVCFMAQCFLFCFVFYFLVIFRLFWHLVLVKMNLFAYNMTFTVDYENCNALILAYLLQYLSFHIPYIYTPFYHAITNIISKYDLTTFYIFKARYSSIYTLSLCSTSCLSCCFRWHQGSTGQRRHVHRVCPASWLLFHVYFLSAQNNMLSISTGDQFHHIRFRNL